MMTLIPCAWRRRARRSTRRALLDGYRGARPMDRKSLAGVIAAIADAALAMGPDLLSMEINPLNISPTEIKAVDALTI
jgi:hypothetical protein